MAVAFDGSRVDGTCIAPCGEVAYFDHDSGYAYRCGTCFAVLGSVAMPRECADRGPTTPIKAETHE